MRVRMMAFGVGVAAWTAIQACGGGSDPVETTTQSNTPPPANPQPAANPQTGATCAAANCPALTLFGSAAPGCCQTSGACGGSIVLMNTPICAPPNVEQVASQFAEPFEGLEEEAIVMADECPGLTFQGTTIPGCCDPTGVCGISTAFFAMNPNNPLPFNIPVTCLSQTDVQAIGIVPAGAFADAGAPAACSAGM